MLWSCSFTQAERPDQHDTVCMPDTTGLWERNTKNSLYGICPQQSFRHIGILISLEIQDPTESSYAARCLQVSKAQVLSLLTAVVLSLAAESSFSFMRRVLTLNRSLDDNPDIDQLRLHFHLKQSGSRWPLAALALFSLRYVSFWFDWHYLLSLRRILFGRDLASKPRGDAGVLHLAPALCMKVFSCLCWHCTLLSVQSCGLESSRSY